MNTESIIGPAGSGKSTVLRKRMEDGARYLLTSTTGISAVNLGPGVTTVHSSLGFYDLRSLRELHSRGGICAKALALARKGVKTLVIDEMSMLSADALQLIHEGFQDAQNLLSERAEGTGLKHYRNEEGRLLTGEDACGILLVGDVCQLPPIPDRLPDGKSSIVRYAFEAPCWASYEAPGNMTHLTKIWRQDDARFLSALALVRRGNGVDGAIDLKKAGVEFTNESDNSFDGITLFAVNDQVDAFNSRRLASLPGEVVRIPSERWGKERSEWKNIPAELGLKDGALVMVLANDSPEFRYVNGDLATFHAKCNPLSYILHDEDTTSEANHASFEVETKRGYRGAIPFIVRRNVGFTETDEDALKAAYNATSWGRQLASTDPSTKQWRAIYLQYVDMYCMRSMRYYDPYERGVVIGEIRYMPLRVAYASTVHKVQGLTLDKVQVNIGHYWFGNPSMVYVALSRARSIAGLRIVGDVGRLARRIKTDRRCVRWI